MYKYIKTSTHNADIINAQYCAAWSLCVRDVTNDVPVSQAVGAMSAVKQDEPAGQIVHDVAVLSRLYVPAGHGSGSVVWSRHM